MCVSDAVATIKQTFHNEAWDWISFLNEAKNVSFLHDEPQLTTNQTQNIRLFMTEVFIAKDNL